MSDERDLKSHQIMELSRELERVRAEKAEAAIERVLALANHWEAAADEWEPTLRDWQITSLAQCRRMRAAAEQIREAVAGA